MNQKKIKLVTRKGCHSSSWCIHQNLMLSKVMSLIYFRIFYFRNHIWNDPFLYKSLNDWIIFYEALIKTKHQFYCSMIYALKKSTNIILLRRKSSSNSSATLGINTKGNNCESISLFPPPHYSYHFLLKIIILLTIGIDSIKIKRVLLPLHPLLKCLQSSFKK